jgi:hypothetical protein
MPSLMVFLDGGGPVSWTPDRDIIVTGVTVNQGIGDFLVNRDPDTGYDELDPVVSGLPGFVLDQCWGTIGTSNQPGQQLDFPVPAGQPLFMHSATPGQMIITYKTTV